MSNTKRNLRLKNKFRKFYKDFTFTYITKSGCVISKWSYESLVFNWLGRYMKKRKKTSGCVPTSSRKKIKL